MSYCPGCGTRKEEMDEKICSLCGYVFKTGENAPESTKKIEELEKKIHQLEQERDVQERRGFIGSWLDFGRSPKGIAVFVLMAVIMFIFMALFVFIP
ncbi:MAG: hypothetical protein ACFFAS_05115 [Promethearchaeota archaeon]